MTTGNASGAGRHRRRGRRSRWVVLVAGVVAVVLTHPWSWSFTGIAGSHSRPASRATGTVGTGAPGAAVLPVDARRFATGACAALAPTSGDRHETVFLDAGHGGPDPGASGTTDAGQEVREKDVTLPVALAAARLLRAQGYRVVLSRTTDSSVAMLTPADLNGPVLTTAGEHADLIARVACADLSGAAALVSIHFDSYPDPGVGGATTLYDAVRPFAAANLALATALQHTIVAGLATGGWPVPDRGIATDTTAGGGEITAAGTAYGHLDLLGPVDPGYVDHPTTMPGALVEPLFLSDPAEAALAVNPSAQQAIASGVAGAVDDFFHAR